MSIKNTCTTSDYMEWNTMLNLIQRLYRDGDTIFSLLIGCGCFFGLRISDLLGLRWEQILDQEYFTITERKTQKQRKVKINSHIQKHIQECYEELGSPLLKQHCFISKSRKSVLSIQWINVHLKEIKKHYHIDIQRISSHTLRKTFGRRIFESSGEKADLALVKLMEIFNHSSVQITKRYLGIRQDELMEAYDLLDM